MKRLLLILFILTFSVLGFIAFFGGFHYYTYSKFIPASGIQLRSKEDFRPHIYPVFTKGGTIGLKCIIPYLFYRERTSEIAPIIVVSTHDTFDNYGYLNRSKVIFNTVTVRNELGDIFQLIAAEAPKELSFSGLGSGSGIERLGAIKGKKITISAKGYTITTQGKREEFIHEETWTQTHSSRMGLGASFGE